MARYVTRMDRRACHDELGREPFNMAPSVKLTKPTKAAKPDLRMFFGPGGGQPKTVKATNSQVCSHRREGATLT